MVDRLINLILFLRFLRMSPERFNRLLSLVTPLISKKYTKFRKSIHSNGRLALILTFLASGESRMSLSFQFRLGGVAVSKIIFECCEAVREIFTKSQITGSGKRLHSNLKIHGICRTSLVQSMGKIFELNDQKVLEANTTTTRDFLALFY